MHDMDLHFLMYFEAIKDLLSQILLQVKQSLQLYCDCQVYVTLCEIVPMFNLFISLFLW
jgi:hypothetical protein